MPVKVNTVTCAGKGFVTPHIHDELPHRFFITTDNSNYLQCDIPVVPQWSLKRYCQEHGEGQRYGGIKIQLFQRFLKNTFSKIGPFVLK